MRRAWKISGGVGIALLAAVGVFLISGPGRDLRNLWSHGVIQSVIEDPAADRKYSASRQSNLKAIYTALDLYQDSEGAYPPASGWMDAIQSRLRTNDMSREEGEKKLMRPNIANPEPGKYGYAINEAVAGKYKGDIKELSTPLVFESSDLKRNASGPADHLKGVLAVTVSGELKKL